MIKNKTGRNVQTIRSDNGAEYTSLEFSNFCNQNGISMQRTAPYNPEQNGISERLNRTLDTMALCLKEDSGCPDAFWGDAVDYANFIRNRIPSASIMNKSPFELWNGYAPDVNIFRTFGCDAFVIIPASLRKKFGKKLNQLICKMIGYSGNQKAYKIWVIETQKVIFARNVTFNEVTPHLGFYNKDKKIYGSPPPVATHNYYEILDKNDAILDEVLTPSPDVIDKDEFVDAEEGDDSVSDSDISNQDQSQIPIVLPERRSTRERKEVDYTIHSAMKLKSNIYFSTIN